MSTQFTFQNISISNYSGFQTVLIQLIQFSISTYYVNAQLNVKTVLYITIQLSVSRVSMSKTVQIQTIRLSTRTQFKFKYCLIVKNISISS